MGVIANPYQEVIDWLRSPAGEKWSENRIAVAKARQCTSASQLTLTSYGDKELLCWKGILSVKRDNDPRHSAIFVHRR